PNFKPISSQHIGEFLVIEPATITRSLRLLQKDGLIEIAPRGLRRQRLLTLTSKAEKALAVAVPLWREMQARFLAGLGKEWQEFRDGLEHAAGVAGFLRSLVFVKGKAAQGPPRRNAHGGERPPRRRAQEAR